MRRPILGPGVLQGLSGADAFQMDAPIILRPYGVKTGDFQNLDRWWQARHSRPFPENIIPPLGIVAEIDGEPMGALFCYESVGIGVAHLDFGVVRPGLSFVAVKAIMGRLIEGIIHCLKQRGTGLLRCFCETPAMERALRFYGFHGKRGNTFRYL